MTGITWLHDLPRAHAPDTVALIDHDGQRFSYGDYCAMIDRLADALAAHGLRAGDRLMVVCENCATYGVAAMAAFQLGAWLSPINARQSDTELDAIRSHSGARMMLFTPEASQAAADHAARLGAISIGTLPCGDIRVTECYDTAPEPVGDTPENRTAVLMYTTGTTSAPKGVMLSHANLKFGAKVSAELRRVTPDDEVIAVLPGTHIFCLVSPFLGTLHGGGTVRFMARFNPQAVLEALAQGATALPAVPQMFQAIFQHLADTGQAASLPRLRYTSSGGAPLDPSFKTRTEALFGVPLFNGYGQTETTSGSIGTSANDLRDDVSVGVPFPGVAAKIDAPNAEGVGELLVKSPGIMQGYYKNPQATAQVLRDDGYIRSGDLARIDESGAVHIVGRCKELIIRSGFNVYPPEIEAMLTKHPAVRQAAVVGHAVAGNEDILAFVTTDGSTDEPALRAWLKDRLVGYKVPQRVFLIEAFPAAASGKILKRQLTTDFAHLLDAPASAQRATAS